MKFKSYSGRTLAEIVPKIRSELGPEAVILKQRPTRVGGVGGFFAHAGIEVLAADALPDADAGADAPAVPAPMERQVDVSDSDDNREQLLRETFAAALREHVAQDADIEAEPAAAEPEPTPEPAVAAPPAAEATGAYTAHVRPFEPVRIRSERNDAGLKVGPGTRPAAEPAPLDEEAEFLALELERSGITRRSAETLAREVRFHVQPFSEDSLRDAARRRIASRIRVEQGWAPSGTARKIAIIGGSGAGKTTAVANLAAAFATAGMTVGVVVVARATEGTDGVLPRLGAAGGSQADHALAYMAGADVCRASTADEVGRGLARLAARDVVLIDTPGIAPDADDALVPILRAARPDEIHAAVPLAIAEREASALLARLERLGANRLLVTRVDEARFAGPLYELATSFELPLGYLGCGPTVPGGLKPADGGSIAARILPM
jgi:flagellar biosynthesis protein FlhF